MKAKIINHIKKKPKDLQIIILATVAFLFACVALDQFLAKRRLEQSVFTAIGNGNLEKLIEQQKVIRFVKETFEAE